MADRARLLGWIAIGLGVFAMSPVFFGLFTNPTWKSFLVNLGLAVASVIVALQGLDARRQCEDRRPVVPVIGLWLGGVACVVVTVVMLFVSNIRHM